MSDISGTSSTPSGMTGAGGGQLLRITGMATGLDVDAMVKKMMTAEQTKLDKAKQDQQTIQWKQEAYQDIIKDIKDLQSSFFDSTSSDKNILSSINFSPFTVSGIGGAAVDTSSVTFTPGVGTQTGKYTVSFKNFSGVVDGQLAAAAVIPGSNIALNTSNGFTQSNWDKGTNTGDVAKTIGFSISGAADQIITLNNSHTSLSDTVYDINQKISANSSLKGKVQAVVIGGNIQFQALSDSSVKISNTNTTVVSDLDNLKGRVVNPSTSTTMSDLGLTGTGNSLNFTCNGTAYSVSVNGTDKISDVINNINSKTSGAVTAKFSQLTGQFTLQTAGTGSSQSLVLISSTASSVLGLTDTSNKTGQDAIVYITPQGSNTSTKVIKPTNNFTIDGMSYSLSTVSSTDISVSVGTDTQKVYDKIKSLIDKYNTVVDEIQTKLNEKKDYNYKPLTDTQKQTMSASQISAWETKAKVGILKSDDNLQNMLNSLRTAFTTAVNNTGLSFGSYGNNSFGIDTSTDYNKPAHIDIVDASKLKDAIANKSAQILKFFTNTSGLTLANSTPYSGSAKYQEDGVFTRIKSILETNVGYTNTTLNSALLTSYANKQYDYSTTGTGGKGTIPDQLYEQQLMIKKITDSMSTKQEKYYQQFSKLETAMNTLNAQQAQLSSLLGQ